MIVLGAFQAHPMDFESLSDSIELKQGDDELTDHFHAALLVVDGDEMIDSTAERIGDKPFLVLADENRLLEMVELGCSGFVSWDASSHELLEALSMVLDGRAVIPPDKLGTLLKHIVRRRREADERPSGWAELTDRERQVYQLAARGADRNEIANELFISPETVRTHLQRVYQKLGVHSQTELMSLSRTDSTIGDTDA